MEGAMRFVILMTILPFATEFDFLRQEQVAAGTCDCALFAVPEAEPIMEHTLQYNVSCDQEGTETCQELCIALAKSARDNAPSLICEKLNTHIENLEVAVYMKLCDMSLWTFTGLKSIEPICCHEGKATICNEAMINKN